MFYRKYIDSILKVWLTGIGLTYMVSALAIPSKPGIIKIKQCDGSVVDVVLKGDEHSHAWFTPDGYPLVREGDTFYYANVTADGTLEASPVRLNAFPSQSERDFRAGFNPAEAAIAMNSAVERHAANRRKLPGLYPGASFPLSGEQRALVVLVEYQDVSMTMPNAHDYFSRMLNEEGFADNKATGSARDFYLKSSNGNFDCHFDVYGPIKLSQNRVYYGGNDPRTGQDTRPEQMAIEACQQLDATVDFTQYDRDGDGYIDNVFIFYAGRGESSGAPAETIWPHSFNVVTRYPEPYMFDGVRLNRYACSYEWENGAPDGIGTFVHEFGHVLGLPDIYTTDYGASFTPGPWCTMDRGPYNNGGKTPPYFSAYERASCGWIEPVLLDRPMSVTLPDISHNKAALVQTAKDNEYFLFENRQQSGWDQFIPGHGMLVWHIDFDAERWRTNSANNTPGHQRIDIEEADGLASEETRAGDAFPGTLRVEEFGDDTKPGMRAWNGKRQYRDITNIREKDGVISFDVMGGAKLAAPTLACSVTDDARNVNLQWDSVMIIPNEEGDPYAPTHYLLNVYKHDENGDRVYLEGYEQHNVGNVNACTLSVPEGTYFATIQAAYALQPGDESTPVQIQSTNSVCEVTRLPEIEVCGNSVTIKGCAPSARLVVYNLLGSICATAQADHYGETSLIIDMPGVYLLHTDKILTKIVVR